MEVSGPCPFVCAAGQPRERLGAGENEINQLTHGKNTSQGEKTRPVTT